MPNYFKSPKKKINILLIDDEPLNLEILTDYLWDAGFNSKCFENPLEAWNHLDNNPNLYHCILLDRMMPQMDGLVLLSKIKSDKRFQHIPVIMQTADGSHDSLCSGMRKGAFYYLTKPFSKDLLLTVVEVALADYSRYLVLKERLQESFESLKLMTHAEFKFQTLQQGDVLAAMLAKSCPNPEKVVLGLSELFINAIEHGNLEIDFDCKTELLADNIWGDYIKQKLNEPPFSDRYVTVKVRQDKNGISFNIIDQGNGFDWQDLDASAAQRVMQSHGRGLLIAKNLSFDKLEFIGCGNHVAAFVKYNLDKTNQSNLRSNLRSDVLSNARSNCEHIASS